MACARCHDHKFDPFLTEDYYALAGMFFSTHILADPGPKTNGPPMLRIPLVSKDELERRKLIEETIAGLEKQVKDLFGKLKSLKDPKDQKDVALQTTLFEKLTRDIDELKKAALPPVPFANGAQEGGCPKSPQEGAHDVRVHIRGRYDRLGPIVPRRFPLILAGENQKLNLHGSGRMELARWIASPTNPLTARVMVNRIWQHHMGEGIVRTPGNFGKLGEPPTHPDLLDYLAGSFVGSGWSIKAMHRAIMQSAVYQQSSIPERETFQADPDNRLWGRMNRRRLEAEELRDSLLAAAGSLQLVMGGRATRDFNVPRRSLYLMTIRSDRSSFRELFDAADPTAITDKRAVSTVAPQALFLLNHPFAVEQAKHLVRRSLGKVPGNEALAITRLYILLFGRPPAGQEVSIGQTFLRSVSDPSQTSYKEPSEAAWIQYGQVLLCSNEFACLD
jgi:hypothetical protein